MRAPLGPLVPEPGAPREHLIATGRDADVFALGEGRVLRRYRGGADAAAEAEVMTYVAGHGYPVPAVHSVAGPDMVMDRLDGPTMSGALGSGLLDAEAAARMLADLHDRLHRLPARVGADPADRVVHLDLHPENVVVTASGPVVIDWRNATDGPPDDDVALTALILAQVAVDAADPRSPLARALLEGFLVHVEGDAARGLDHAVARRGADTNVTTAERDRLGRAAALVRAKR